MEAIIWLIFCGGVAYYASQKNRSPILWGLLAFIFSPLLAGIVLALLKDNKVAENISEIRMDQQQLRERVSTNEKISEMKFQQVQQQLGQGGYTPQQQLGTTQPPQQLEGDYKLCPFCKEKIKKDAIKCRYCHQMLDQVQDELCPFCKESVLSIDEFCPHCGSKIERPAAAPAENKVVNTDDVQPKN